MDQTFRRPVTWNVMFASDDTAEHHRFSNAFVFRFTA
ncbi:hypothetical protein K227x_23380 [Rubripirellula lacrimiformis]|uniref:Uncharacterized protein n=1 Tax=Rubripirellula lacrimiformis TaxID=1930273 RepID=A0A517N9Z8_9BACT|nr:hypothetical protein K227x_23380 [Rubripirellula lacrimiformis]